MRLDLSDSQNAFEHLSDKRLKKSHRLFQLMGNPKLVNSLSQAGLRFLKWNIPGTRYMIEQTLFSQFCGGKSLNESTPVIEHLWKHNVRTYLDYGAEGKNTDKEYEETLRENKRAVAFANDQEQVPVVVSKISGLVANQLLIKRSEGEPFSADEQRQFEKLQNRLESLAEQAASKDTSLYIDAEESWLQIAIDELAIDLMRKYNKSRPVIYNTYQLYRHDKLEQLKTDIQISRREGYFFGAKLVRGAYMDKERRHAKSKGKVSPIHKTKSDTDKDFNEALIYCLDHLDTVAFCCASHNDRSNLLLAETMEARGIATDHPHIHFCQLYGMSDNITFNLAKAQFNAAKYVVYGPVEEVFPYLVRRAEENSSVTGEVGRELSLIQEEMQRRNM